MLMYILYLLLDKPCNVTRNLVLSGKTATVTFSSDNTKATFKCKLDQKRFKSCKYICVYIHLYVHVCMCITYCMYIIQGSFNKYDCIATRKVFK